MKKYFLVIILFFLMIIVSNFAGNENESKSSNINKKASVKNESIFKIPTVNSNIYDKRSIILKFKPGISKIQKNKLADLVSGNFKDRNNDGIDDRYSSIMGGSLILLELKGGKNIDLATPALAVLKEHPNIEYAEYNYRQYLNFIPSDPLFRGQWGMNNTGQTDGAPDADIDAPEAWDITVGSSEVIVGVIDTGVDYNHEDLAANIWINPNEIPGNGIDDDNNSYIDDIHGINSIIENGDPMDDYYHGTHCSGIIGATGNNSRGVAGVNWLVKIVCMKFLDSDGSGWTADAIECINYAVWLKNHGVNIRVLSNSWGGGNYEQSLADAITYATNAGILFTAAAGNRSRDNDIYPFYPACYPHVLAVASTDSTDGLSNFSDYGVNTVHLGAPGSDILSTVLNNNYRIHSGTSMATPHVSGAAALLLAINDRLTIQEIKDYLIDYGDTIPALVGKTVSGKRLNLYNSLAQVPPLEPTFRLSATPVSQEIEIGQSVSYTINIHSVLEYSNPVTLSASSNPPIDANISFSPNPSDPGSTSLMTVATTNATDTTEYIITITGSDGSIVKNTSVLLEVTPIGIATVSYTNNTIIPIPDCDSGITGAIDIPDPLKIWETAVTVNITHTYIGDLVIKLISPTGTEAILHDHEGGWSSNIHKTYYPFQFKNEGCLGTWKLFVADEWCIDAGTLDSWTLTISGTPVNPLPPVADFRGYPTIISVGRSVNFTDLSTNYPSSRLWTFNGGNPSTSTMINPVVTYNTVGRFDVSYKVSNPQGSDTETKPGYITVVPYQAPPVADFTASSVSISDGKQVTFTDKSTNTPTSWSWTFPGGEPSHSDQRNPTVTYNTMGIYDVTLSVSNPGGNNAKTKNNYIQVSKFSSRGIGPFDFSSPYDSAIVFDYNNDRIDDLFLYRPGSGVACVIRSNGNGTFDNVYYANGVSSKGIGLYDLMSITDRALKIDYNGDGNEDLFLYRPGSGAVGVVRSNGDGTFTSVYNVIDNGSDPPNGIGGYTLLSSKDRVLAFHLNDDDYEDLLLYRPSRGAISVLTSRGDGTFRSFYSVIDNGPDIPNGICWFDLLASNDKALAFNYNGHIDEELLFYRSGRGAVGIVSPNLDGTFRNVYSVIDNGSAYPNGIGGYDLLSTKDIVLAFDYDGDTFKDLLLFRPGRGAISVVHSNWDETFSSVYRVIDNGATLPNGICEFDLLSTNDMALIFDYNGDGFEDIFFYRPGSGALNIVCSNGDGTFRSEFSVIDNGSNPPNGIGGYNLLSLNDCALAYDYDGDGKQGLFLYRPRGRLVGIIPCKK